jgi:outer membrane receptor protein involved in Fe transport
VTETKAPAEFEGIVIWGTQVKASSNLARILPKAIARNWVMKITPILATIASAPTWHNLSAHWQPTAVKGLEFGKLLMDYEPGRNAKLTVSYRF